MDEQTCCFVGHRLIPKEKRRGIRKKLEWAICTLIELGVTTFLTSGTLGFDIMAAGTVLRLKRAFPHIRLILVLPQENQIRHWRDSSIANYRLIREHADGVIFLLRQNGAGHTEERMQYLAEHSDWCICYLSGEVGETRNTVEYLKSQAIPLVNIAKKPL